MRFKGNLLETLGEAKSSSHRKVGGAGGEHLGGPGAHFTVLGVNEEKAKTNEDKKHAPIGLSGETLGSRLLCLPRRPRGTRGPASHLALRLVGVFLDLGFRHNPLKRFYRFQRERDRGKGVRERGGLVAFFLIGAWTTAV